MVTEELEGLGAGTGQVVKKGIDSILGDKSPHEFPGISLFETQPDQQPGLDQERPKFQDSSQNGGHQNSKEAVLSPLPLASGASGEALSADKGEISKTHSFEGRQRSGDPGVSPDQTFIIKKHGPSSMEVFLESEGLGKLGIELKISHDKIQGQIMVNDSKGKDVMENNLPRLLSEMANDGLQIGQFTVSLKNQGREQNQTPFFQPEPRARPGAGVEPEVIPPLNTQNHLIHIII
jgi:flagellar hook-length control protein FliK